MSIEQAGRYGRAFAKHGKAFAQRQLAREKMAQDGTDPDDDAGETLPASIAKQLCEFCQDKMSDADFSEFTKLIEGLSGVAVDEDAETEEERKERLAKRGGENAFGLDTRKAEREFSKLFPDARPLLNSGFDTQGGRAINTARAESEFHKLFPDVKPLVRA
jgi:hypothetical protein